MSTTIVLFRQDLRLHDHPALTAAAQRGTVIPVYILDDDACGDWPMGGASRWWLKQSLLKLKSTIAQSGGQLILRRGNTLNVLEDLQKQSGADAIYFSRQYQPWSAHCEKAIKDTFDSRGVEVRRYPGTLLHEPGSVLTGSGTGFKVFTPFWRAALKLPVATPLPSPLVDWAASLNCDEDLNSWLLDPEENAHVSDWAAGWEEIWQPGEDGAHNALEAFLEAPVAHYAEGRDLPAHRYTSRLSPHLKFGEISPRQVWASAQQRKLSAPEWTGPIDKFLAEIGWREFCYQLIDLFDAMPDRPFKDQFANFPWDNSKQHLKAWQRGMTGYPIVDAGMRELWQTGFMHNRVRMIVASFLTKHLLVHWLEGERWFWDCLLDADIASNACSWQWVAGSGADAAPYFRIFNPIAQGQKFDSEGAYVKRWCPELAELPKKFVHAPWEAPAMTLSSAGIELGKTYPEPIVDHKTARQGALDAYEFIKKAS